MFTEAHQTQLKIDKLVLDKIEKASDIVGENRLLILGDFNVPDVDWEEN